MTCAVVEFDNGKRSHYTNVLECWVGMVRGRSYVKLRLVDETVATIESAISARLVDDEWFVINQLGVGLRC